MANRVRPTLTVTIDADIRAELDLLRKNRSLNVSNYVSALLRQRFPKKPARQKAK